MAKVDQRRFDNQRRELLSSQQAAALLGVKARTLYAYASRGLVGRIKVGQQSRYARADLERLKLRHDARSGHAPVAAAALNWGEPVLATRISSVDAEGPRYRGHLATDLARRGVPFLEVCQLLWTGTLGPLDAGSGPRARRRRTPGRVSHPDPIVRLMAIVMDRLAHDNAPFGLAPAFELRRAQAVLRALAGGAGPHPPGPASDDPATRFLQSFGLAPTAGRRRLTDAALVLCADHELNASTFAARVAASTGADLHACLLAALAAFLGPRHGAASRGFEAVLAQLPRAGGALALVTARTTRGEGMPGFGHPLYPDGDPRASTLLELALAQAPARALATCRALIAATLQVRGERPNIDAALVAVTRAVGLPAGAGAALFAVGRAAGWVAHVLEQRESSAVLRPRARYVGSPPELPIGAAGRTTEGAAHGK